MQPESRDRAPSPTSSSFAGLLAALTLGKTEQPGSEAQPRRAWTDGLEDDVATLSYERALEHHARSRPEGIGSGSLGPGALAQIPAAEEHFQPGGIPAAAAQAKVAERPETSTERGTRSGSRLELSRKRASVTVRLTESEFAQLQERATEAGMTVSAYLRSCTFEAESLRAQVKQTLAELRAASPVEAGSMARHNSGLRWLGFLRRRTRNCEG